MGSSAFMPIMSQYTAATVQPSNLSKNLVHQEDNELLLDRKKSSNNNNQQQQQPTSPTSNGTTNGNSNNGAPMLKSMFTHFLFIFKNPYIFICPSLPQKNVNICQTPHNQKPRFIKVK